MRWWQIDQHSAAPQSAEQVETNSGPRLIGLRAVAGVTQIELAAELETSRRMVAYYESLAATPPPNLLPRLIDAFIERGQLKRKAESRA